MAPARITPEIARLGMPEVMRRAHERYGEVVRLPVPARTMVLLAHPDAVKHVLLDNRTNYVKGRTYDDWRLLAGMGLVSNEGDFWKRQRKLASPAFHHRQIQGIGSLVTRATGDMLAAWERGGAGRFDLHEEMTRLTLRIVGEALFAQDLSVTTDTSTAAFAVALRAIIERGNAMVALPLKVPTPGNLRLRKALRTLDGLVYDIIARHRREAKDDGTLLSMFVAAVDDETGERMTDVQLRDEVITMFIAGHETTALALTWTWHLLAGHPHVVAKLEAELTEVLGDREPTVEDVPKLTYTRMVVDEAMRVRPPVWTVARDVVADDEVGGSLVPAGTTVMLSQWVTHKRADFWPDPERFDPERFAAEAVKAQHKYAYFPFSAGPRICIGNQFSLMEGVLILAQVCRRWRLANVPGHVVEPDIQITYRPKNGLPMLRERR